MSSSVRGESKRSAARHLPTQANGTLLSSLSATRLSPAPASHRRSRRSPSPSLNRERDINNGDTERMSYSEGLYWLTKHISTVNSAVMLVKTHPRVVREKPLAFFNEFLKSARKKAKTVPPVTPLSGTRMTASSRDQPTAELAGLRSVYICGYSPPCGSDFFWEVCRSLLPHRYLRCSPQVTAPRDIDEFERVLHGELRHLQQARVFLLLLSEHTLANGLCTALVQLAVHMRRPIRGVRAAAFSRLDMPLPLPIDVKEFLLSCAPSGGGEMVWESAAAEDAAPRAQKSDGGAAEQPTSSMRDMIRCVHEAAVVYDAQDSTRSVAELLRHLADADDDNRPSTNSRFAWPTDDASGTSYLGPKIGVNYDESMVLRTPSPSPRKTNYIVFGSKERGEAGPIIVTFPNDDREMSIESNSSGCTPPQNMANDIYDGPLEYHSDNSLSPV
ncbi:PREDICTED: uncharacterized protein LOC106806715 [Priapulus caudatus]|uniref:Uncharacterized protein LOC106806715 n=1 Tax=Priapulus caudatus TaxID=37621 RepID=A0ABM1DWB5_PRICU|nr:PREDICTED: uncharacterized protein LOC106806715 [Priapulus caudatus]